MNMLRAIVAETATGIRLLKVEQLPLPNKGEHEAGTVDLSSFGYIYVEFRQNVIKINGDSPIRIPVASIIPTSTKAQKTPHQVGTCQARRDICCRSRGIEVCTDC